jgi:V/A-type H+-transporting ATPase subunit E
MNSIKDLTDQLFQEGVEKGRQEAQKLIDEAGNKKSELIAAARQEAAQIIEAANKKAQELDKNTKAELQLFARQSLDALKSEIVNLLTDKVVRDAIQLSSDDKAFMQNLLLSFVKNWAQNGELEIQTEEANALTAFFRAKAADLLEKGLTIKQVNNLNTHFVLTAKDGSYKIQFGEEEFTNYFKEFLRPQLVEMLF